MSDIRYTEDHEWVRVEGDIATSGSAITPRSSSATWCSSTCPRSAVRSAGAMPMAVVESVKAASDVYAPVGGEVVEVNAALNDDPSLVNSGAESGGWFCRIRLGDRAELDVADGRCDLSDLRRERDLSRGRERSSSMSEDRLSLRISSRPASSRAGTSARTRPRSRRCSRWSAPPRSTT